MNRLSRYPESVRAPLRLSGTVGEMTSLDAYLLLALRMADAADQATLKWWNPSGVATTVKSDGSPVTEADVAAERAVLEIALDVCPDDGFLGEEIGEKSGSTGRRWIVDGVDGTRAFAAGLETWGTLIALEQRGEIVLGVASSPAQDRRWWASRGGGAYTGTCSADSRSTPLRVSAGRVLVAERVVTKPTFVNLALEHQEAIARLIGAVPVDAPWSHQLRVAEGQADLCVWFCGDVWDHAAPSIIVEEAGGRFTDLAGGKRLDSRTAIYSNGATHDVALAALLVT